MANTHRQIKSRINTASNIAKITKAMEMVAASKMKRAQAQAGASRAFAKAIQESLQKVAALTNSELHPLLSQHKAGKRIIVLVSTNKGLCGGFNTNLFKKALELQKIESGFEIIAIGKKAVQFSHKMGWTMLAQFTQLPEYIQLADVLPLTTLIMEKFLLHEFRSVELVYMDFINTITQEVSSLQVLPIAAGSYKKDSADAVKPLAVKKYLFEPSPYHIFDSLLPYYVENTVFQVLLESKASEHSARMVAMKNANENALELVGELKLEFNKSRQAGITEALRDIATASLTIN